MGNFKEISNEMKSHGLELRNCITFKLDNAKDILNNACNYYITNFQWLKEYDEIADWLSDNKRKGLFMFGANGRGKTILGKEIIPAIFLKYHEKVLRTYDSQQMNKDLDRILIKRIVSIDDIGTEDLRIVFGEKRWAFPEIIDKAEKSGNIIILTTNLNAKSIEEIYGIRTLERIKATCRRVKFDGMSLRN